MRAYSNRRPDNPRLPWDCADGHIAIMSSDRCQQCGEKL